MTTDPDKGTAKSRYTQLEANRLPFLQRARDCATLTVPYLMPPEGMTAGKTLPTPYQSLGARGIRTLSAKLLLSLFPPNTPFFKYAIDDFLLQKLTGQDGMRGEVEKALSARERATVDEMESAQMRLAASIALQHLLVAGNFLLHVPPRGRVRGFRLDQFVVKRDASGNVLEIVVKELVSPTVLPQAIAEAVKAEAAKTKGAGSEDKSAELYTHIVREHDQWSVYQEAGGAKIDGTEGTYPIDRCPWLVLRLATQPGEDYGRSYVEEFLGDLDSLEGLSETLVEGSAAAARIVFLVKPNGVTQVKVVSKAKNGDVAVGNAEDVTVIQAQKQADLAVAQKQAQEIATRLAYAFLLNTAIQRSAERVTAEEIKYMAQELDDALGGMYALLSAELQLPVVLLFEDRMEKNRQVAELPKGFVKPTITTGMAAIGRGIDLRNLRAFTADIVQTLGPEIAFRYLQPTEYIKRAAAAYGIDTGGLVKPDAVIAQEEQLAKLEALIQNLGPQALQAAGGMGKEVVKGAIQQQGDNGQAAPPG
ncbi:phage tail protein [Rhodopseudomonas palustris]|uniref:Phage tail protein n=1 Tax=Rhodopseudomonas palustris TaxID=1076 RepID=A0A323UNI8_RHOPL|nr:portal protein [Rhodopseudomonas palustris]PZA13959.1 phage tail protein [Rhodopseudomonas palustris]